jgi:threonine synthase
MDVGSASNMERLLHLFGGEEGTRSALRAFLVDDDEIRRVIREGPGTWGEVWDPHTATAVAVRERLDTHDWIVVSTAHPAKFESVVEPLIGREIPVPADLAHLLDRPSHATPIDPDLDTFIAALETP